MGRPVNLVILLAVIAAGIAFVGTLVSAPTPFNALEFGSGVRVAAAQGDWAAVERLARRASRQEPSNQDVLLFLGISVQRQGQARGGREAWTRLRDGTRANMNRGNGAIHQWYYLGWALHGLGDERGAAAAWGELARRQGPEAVGYNAVCYLALAGQIEEALTAWEGVEVGQFGVRTGEDLRWIRVDPDLDVLREDPRFRRVMERLDRELMERRRSAPLRAGGPQTPI